jgi:hypothetical protein
MFIITQMDNDIDLEFCDVLIDEDTYAIKTFKTEEDAREYLTTEAGLSYIELAMNNIKIMRLQ